MNRRYIGVKRVAEWKDVHGKHYFKALYQRKLNGGMFILIFK